MQNAIWLSSIFGPFLLIVGLWSICYHDALLKALTSIKNTAGTYYMFALINLIFGLGILSMYNVWMMDATVLLTLLGWIWLIRGVLALFAPHFVMKHCLTNHSCHKAMGIIPFLCGVVLTWVAFFM